MVNYSKIIEIEHQLRNEDLCEETRGKLTASLYKLQNRPEWGLRVLFCSAILFFLILTITLTSK